MVQTNTESIRLWACAAQWTFTQIAVGSLLPSMSANAEGRYSGVRLHHASKVHIDYAGNIIGKRAGKKPTLAPIMFGSHIDSVPGGGEFVVQNVEIAPLD